MALPSVGFSVLLVFIEYCVAFCDIGDIAHLQNVQKRLLLSDFQWKLVAHAYVIPANFWAVAERRPKYTSRPLKSWKDELHRIVTFKQKCKALNFVVDDYYIMQFWEYIDSGSIESRQSHTCDAFG